MKAALLFCLFIISANTYSQTILADKKDFSAKTRTISTGINPLYKTNAENKIQVQSQLNIENNSIASYQLNFTAVDLPATDNTNSPDACLLKDENGATYGGVLTDESSSNGQVYTCKFSKEDFFKIIALKITDIKITTGGKEGLFQIDEKLQDIISNQAKAVLARSKENK